MRYYSPAKEKLILTSSRGWRWIGGRLSFHRGYDLAPGLGYNPNVNPIYLYPTHRNSQGVAYRHYEPRGFGHYVSIKWDDGSGTVLSHMHEIIVENNQRVGFNTKLGVLGTSGLSTNYHVHWEEHRKYLGFSMFNTISFNYLERQNQNMSKLNLWFKTRTHRKEFPLFKNPDSSSRDGIIKGGAKRFSKLQVWNDKENWLQIDQSKKFVRARHIDLITNNKDDLK